MKTRRWLAAAATAAMVGVVGPAWAAIGLGARFGDLILEGVQPGRTYDLREAARVPFAVENQGDAEAEVLIEFERPGKAALATGYEPIPDPSWLKAVPERLVIAPKAVGYFNMMLTIPDDAALKGRSFQAAVKGRTVGTGLLAVAVEGRLRFSLGQGPDSIREEKKRKAMQRLDFDITPRMLYLTEVPVGRAWDSRREAGKTIRVANYAPDPFRGRLIMGAWDPSVPMPEGYEKLPDPGWVRVSKTTVNVETDEIQTTGLVVEVPDLPQNRGRRWAAMVRAELASGYWLDMPVRIFVETKP